MSESSFKISDLEVIPSYINEDNQEKIALESTYFLTYSHTIHGMNYTTKNYKVPLKLLRDDLLAEVNSMSNVNFNFIGDDYIDIIFNEGNYYLSFDSSKLSKPVTINTISDDFIKVSKENNTYTISSGEITGSDFIKVSKENNNYNISNGEIIGDDYIKVSSDEGNYQLNFLEREHILAVYDNSNATIDSYKNTSQCIILPENANKIKINLSNQTDSNSENSKKIISSVNFYINTQNITEEIVVEGINSSSDIRWTGNLSGNAPTLKPNKIYSITFELLPGTIFQNTSLESDSHIIIGTINWFIPLQ